MSIRSHGIAAFAASLIMSSAFAQDIEPNQTKAEATAAGTIVLTAGGTITGTTTGTLTTVGSTLVTTVDTYRVQTSGFALGSIYEHRLTITSAVAGHTGTIRGLNQTGAVGTGGTAGVADTLIQTSVTVPDRRNQWYGFGKGEELYYRVQGIAATTAGYTATLSTNTITPGVIAPAFESSGPVTITTIGQTAADTELLLYDSTFTPVPTGLNDDEFQGPSVQSRLRRVLPAERTMSQSRPSSSARTRPHPPMTTG